MSKTSTIIDARRGNYRLELGELFRYKDLFLTLAYRDIRVRYAQSFLGLFWTILQPAINLLIFTLIFGKAMHVDTGGIPYPVFAMAGIIAWSYFSYSLSQAGSSIIQSQNMIKKIYFPRLVIPLSKAVVGLIDFAVAFALYIVVAWWYGYTMPATIIYLPLFVLVIIISSLAAGIWLSALTIRFRDFQYIIPFMVQVGMYITPIAYPASLVPEKYLGLYYLNPMAGVVEGFRWSLVGGEAPHPYAYYSFAAIGVLFVSALFYFRRVERDMADIV